MIRVVGTAGHVDHGKSALVEALTGTHPDRLREERERAMTIDLGFAWMHLADGTEVGIVDVPGHRDFIDNMLAGAGGFQAAILVVAADEGVMPQTREHVAILELLETPRMVVALTKIDALEDNEWAVLVEEDVRRLLASTRYAGAPVVRVSARRGDGLEDLRRVLQGELKQLPGARDIGRPRLAVDRAFVMSGFGVVVTGTLLDGGLHLGADVLILPAEIHGRIRGLQTHRRAVEDAAAGSRVAVNLSGVDIQQVGRGDVLTTPGGFAPTHRIDGQVRILEDAPGPLRHGQTVKVYLGTADLVGKVRLLERDQIGPGESGWAQIVFKRAAVASEQDRFILRRPTPPATLGGGLVVDAHPSRVHRRRDRRVLASLESLRLGRPSDRVVVSLSGRGPAGFDELREATGLGPGELSEALSQLLSEGRAIELAQGARSDTLWVAADWWRETERQGARLLEAYHAEFPLRAGMPREELRSRMRLAARPFEAVVAGLEAQGVLSRVGNRVARAGYSPTLSAAEKQRLADLRARFAASPQSPPSVKESREAVGDELWSLVTARGEFIEVSDEVVFDAETYRRTVSEIREALAGGGSITVAKVRDRYATSRKFALALLEHLDAIGVTVRVGDERRLKESPPQKPGSPSG
jgi:selenocysteine-specific elongation factor